MPYLAWRIPFLSTLNFNANTPNGRLILLVVLTSHCIFCVCLCERACMCVLILLFLGESESRSVCAAVLCSQLADCSVKCAATERRVAPALCRFSGHQKTRKRDGESLSPGPGWVGDESGGELGGSSEAPSPDRRSRAGIKVACFMWLVRYFEVLESPTALTSSSSLVS